MQRLSGLDALNFGVVACPETVPDLAELRRALQDALEELTAISARST